MTKNGRRIFGVGWLMEMSRFQWGKGWGGLLDGAFKKGTES